MKITICPWHWNSWLKSLYIHHIFVLMYTLHSRSLNYIQNKLVLFAPIDHEIDFSISFKRKLSVTIKLFLRSLEIGYRSFCLLLLLFLLLILLFTIMLLFEYVLPFLFLHYVPLICIKWWEENFREREKR